MWKILIVIYVAIAAIMAIGLLIFLFHSWNEISEEEKYFDYPEGAGEAWIAACIFLVISILVAVLWPFLPLALIGVWVYGKIAEKYPDLCGMGEEDVNESEGDCREGGADHFLP